MVRKSKINDTQINDSMEEALATQIPDATIEQETNHIETPGAEPESMIGKVGGTLSHRFGNVHDSDEETIEKLKEKKLSTRGANILQNTSVRDGWMSVDRELLGERSQFYPEDWEFYIRPATVEAIRNWSTVDEENSLNVVDVFNEILKSCLSIKTPTGPKPWNEINAWDRFFFILLIREYTFKTGEQKISYSEPCINCDSDVEFNLDSQSLMYDCPDEEVMQYYDPATRTWMIDPTEYDIESEIIKLYNPTVEKDANIKNWLMARLQENRNFKIEPSFIKFVSWMAPKISKDSEMAKRQMREYQTRFKSFDIEMFTFLEDVIRNITVTPLPTLKATCSACGEEVTAQVNFPNGVRDLFNFNNKSRKFGKK